jgi:replicative DNA helicase
MSLTNTIKQNPASIEDLVVASFIASKKFFVDNSERILGYHKLGFSKSKFTSYINSQIFNSICEIRSRVSEDVIDKQLLLDNINTLFDSGELFADEKETTLRHIEHLYCKATKSTVDFLSGDIFDTWFTADFGESLSTYINTSDAPITFDEVSGTLEKLKNYQAKSESKAVKVYDSIYRDMDVGNIIPSGIPKLDKCMAGGFRCGESTLIAGATGGGKTVMACQLAGQFASLGRKTVFVTTEQPPNELTPRFLANMCSINMELLVQDQANDESTVIPKQLMNDPNTMVKVKNCLDVLQQNMYYVDWSGGEGRSIEKDLDVELDRIKNNDDFEPEIIIFDWVGGALKKEANKDLRIIYLDAAEHLHNIAKKRKLCVIFFAQLNKNKSYNKLRCDSSMLAECTSMPDKASNAIYISAKRSDEGDSSYSLTQVINADKTRKGPGGTLNIAREFQFQRFSQLKAGANL